MDWKKESYLNNHEHKNVLIRLENWSDDLKFLKPYNMVVAYPISKKEVSQFIKKNRRFRLEMNFKNEEEATKELENLLSNKTTFKDYEKHIEQIYRDCI